MEAMWDFLKSMTIPVALVIVAVAIVFLGFGSMLTSWPGIIAMGVIGGGVLYWYWSRKPTLPE
jgi:hypothetical protein